MIRSTLALAALAILALPAAAGAQAFTPGQRVIFSEDFARGDSALRRLRSVSPRIGVGKRGERTFLHARTPSSFEIALPEQLPERYTVEYDFFIPGVNQVFVTLLGRDGTERGTVACGPHTINFSDGQGDDRVTELDERPGDFGGGLEERENHCAIAVDGNRVRLWVNDVLAADEQNLSLGRADRLRVHFAGVEDETLLHENIPVWLSNLRIAALTQP
jgi:hypothetical protein